MLYNYQKQGVEFLRETKKAILADDMGLGKSIQALVAVAEDASIPCLIVCPKTVKLVWKLEIEKWLPGKKAIIVDGTKLNRSKLIASKCDFLIINYEQLKIHELELLKHDWKSLIFDEAHKLKNQKGKTFRAGCHFSVKFANVPIYFLTGTPVLNRPQEIWSLLHLIDKKKYSSYWSWVYRNFRVDTEEYKAQGIRFKVIKEPLDQDGLANSLKPYLLRRERDAVLELPPLNEIVLPVELSGHQLDSYRSMKRNMIAQLSETQLVAAPVVLAQLTRLKQIACSEGILVPPYSCQGAKYDALLDLLDSCSDKKVVIFSQFSKYLDELYKTLKKRGFGIITGDTDMTSRINQVKDFQDKNGTLKGMLIAIKAGGEGITLTEGSVVVFLDLVWTPATIDQAIARVYRNGQTKPVDVYYIRAMNTIENKIDKMLKEKRFLIKSSIPVAELSDLLAE